MELFLQNKNYYLWSLVCLLLSVSVSQAQQIQTTSTQKMGALLELLKTMSCVEDIPPPQLLAEPRYTQGDGNQLCFILPETVPFALDTIRVPFVQTQVIFLDSVLIFPKPVTLNTNTVQFEFIPGLDHGIKYSYTTALFLPICADALCEEVSEIHCSAYQDTVWSIQDSEAPEVTEVSIPELEGSPIPQWSNRSAFEVDARLFDAAGVWQSRLYRRQCGQNSWQQAVLDTTYDSLATDTGFVFADTAISVFSQNLPDGCYEFRVEGRDATHTPESCYPNFELAGNGGFAADSALPHITIKIDTMPPDTVALTCTQSENEILLSWTTAKDPVPGIGLAEYKIIRDGEIIATMPAGTTQFQDTIPISTPETEFSYQIQPLDSLANVQIGGGKAFCLYKPVSQIVITPEPEFTPGDTNQVCWTGSPTIDTFTIFVAPNCDFSMSADFTVSDTCFTFGDLLDGQTYCYWVTAVDRQGRDVFSDTVTSIQDATPPLITQFDIPEKILIQDMNWVAHRAVEINLKAIDSAPGRIVSLLLSENETPTPPISITPETDNLSLVLSDNLQSAECTRIALALTATDAAGNISQPIELVIFLDTVPPAQVTLFTCEQLTGTNGIRLAWTSSSDADNCSGLMSYRIFRDGNLIADLNPAETQYNDILPASTPDASFTYRVQPVDSLGNIQSQGGTSSCDYKGVASITISPMPEFTPGNQNTVCWDITGELISLQVSLDGNSDFRADETAAINNPSISQCHDFQNLNNGTLYAYWLVGTDAQERIVASDTIWSIQDATSPSILGFEFPGGEILNQQVWAYSRQIELRLSAADQEPGEIWNYEINENNTFSVTGTFQDSTTRFDRSINYEIRSSNTQTNEINLSVKVIDGGGNESGFTGLRIFLQENPPRLFAFPNPFNPMLSNTTLRLQNADETEIRIYDFFGNLVHTLSEKINAHDFVWDGRNTNGAMVANGGYICVGTKTKIRFKIAVVKK